MTAKDLEELELMQYVKEQERVGVADGCISSGYTQRSGAEFMIDFG